MSNKSNMDFTKLNSKKKSAPVSPPKKQKVYREVVEVESAKNAEKPAKEEKKKVGRKSWKEPGVEYRRLSFSLREETIQEIKKLLVVKFYDKVSAQDELIEMALTEFIEKYK